MLGAVLLLRRTLRARVLLRHVVLLGIPLSKRPRTPRAQRPLMQMQRHRNQTILVRPLTLARADQRRRRHTPRARRLDVIDYSRMVGEVSGEKSGVTPGVPR